MAPGSFSAGNQENSRPAVDAARADRIALTFVTLLAAYSVVYLFVLAAHFQV
jgi:hypothetical protein